MVEKPSSHPWTAAPWLPWVLGLALFTIVGSHLIAWFNSTSVAGMIRTQQELFVGLTEYQGMLSDLDESTRAIMLAPERSELRRKKSEAVEALQHQLGVLAEKAPIRGPIPKALIGLATHFRKKLIPQADQVQKHAAAPGPFAMDRFRTEYAEVRLQHAERVGELLEETRKLAEQSVSSGQHRLLLSAGFFLLLWSGAMAWLVGQARLQPKVLGLPHTPHAPNSVEHAAHPGPSSHSAHPGSGAPSGAPDDHVAPGHDLPTTPAHDDHGSSASPLAGAPLSDPTAPPPRESDPAPEPPATPTVSALSASASQGVPSPASAAPAEPSSPSLSGAAGGEMSQSQIADLFQQPQSPVAADPVPSPAPSVVTPPPSATPPAAAVAAPTPAPAPAPVAAAPAVLPPGPVDLASLMGEVAEEPAVSPSQVSEPSVGPAGSLQQPATSVAATPSSPPSAPVVVEAPVVSAASAPAAAATVVTEAPPQPEPQPVAAVATPAPLPDVQTLMKGASAMTTEQLTAMLFGVAPASSAPAPAKSAPAAAPAAPPRTITGAEMATLKPGDDTPPVVDLSF